VALYNGWLTNQLQVLRNNGEGTARPVMGQAGVIPLRRHKRRRFQYPLPANDTNAPLPMAAEPSTPYDDTHDTQAAELTSEPVTPD
jgi:hypothetical protein